VRGKKYGDVDEDKEVDENKLQEDLQKKII
jgi:hypothetical protein